MDAATVQEEQTGPTDRKIYGSVRLACHAPPPERIRYRIQIGKVMSDLENEYEEETGSGFNKAILGRIFAVTLFVGLGTFAVVQSMKTKPDPDAQVSRLDTDHDKTDHDKTDHDKTDDEKRFPKLDLKGIGQSSVEKSKQVVEGIGKRAKDLGKSAGKTIQKGVNAITPNTNFNPTANKPLKPTNLKPKGVLPASRSIASKPDTPKPTTTTLKTPPKRFAQANTNVPIIGNQSGFGLRNQNPSTTSSTFNAKPIVGKFGDAGKNLANQAKSAAGNALQKANDTVNATGQSIRNNISSFGPAKTGATASPFKNDLPPIKSGFGKPPANTGSFKANPIVTRPAIPDQGKAAFDSSRKLAPINSAKTNSNAGIFEPRTTPNPQVQTNPNRGFNGPGFGSRQTTGTAQQRPSFPLPNQRTQTPAKSVSTFSGNRAGGSSSIATDIRTKSIPGERRLEGVQAPALTIEKLSPREIQVNQPADFQLVIKNVGRVSAEDVRVFDKIPSGTELINASPEPGSNRSGDLQWNIGKLRPGQEKRIKIQLRPVRHGEIGSVAHVTFATQASMRTLVTKPVLDIVHQAKTTHLIGDEVVFDITVQNKGDGPATNVLIQEDVPQQLEFQDGSNGIEYEIGTLMPGQSRRLQLSLKAAKIGKLRNIMFASADGGLEAKHELPLEVVAPNLVAATEGPKIRYLRRNVTHNFSVVNNGTAPATNVELIARLPSGLRFVDANNQGRYDSNAHSVYWSLAELARDVKAGVELKTMPVEFGKQPIKFETFADLEVRSSVVQPLNVEHLVDVFFDIDDVVDPIEIGSNTSYKIRVVNQGTKAATNVQLKVQFPRGLVPTSVDGSIRHQIAGQGVVFEPISSMSPGDEISFVVHGKGEGPGDHRVVVEMKTDGRATPVSKEETTRVYSDR